MAVRTGGVAPYAPPQTVLHLIRQYRERGLTTPITEAVLLKASVSESLAPRTLAALRNLDLIDSDGNPTPEMEGLRRAKTDEFAPRLEAIVRSIYAEVFQYTDPAKDDNAKIADAFRDYNPAGQRARMVSLFMGLCVASGIVPETAVRKSHTSPTNGRPRPTSALRSSRTPEKHKGPSVGAFARMRNDHDQLIPAAITGPLGSLPAEGEGWTQQRRDAFLKFFTSALDFVYPINAEAASSEDEE